MKRFLLPLVLPLVLLSAGPRGTPGPAWFPGSHPVADTGFVAAIPLESGVLAVFDDHSAIGYDLEANVLGVVAMSGFVGVLEESEASNATGGVAAGQVLRTRWTDVNGENHEVETRVTGTNVDLYVQRHDRLVRAMKRYYPARQ